MTLLKLLSLLCFYTAFLIQLNALAQPPADIPPNLEPSVRLLNMMLNKYVFKVPAACRTVSDYLNSSKKDSALCIADKGIHIQTLLPQLIAGQKFERIIIHTTVEPKLDLKIPSGVILNTLEFASIDSTLKKVKIESDSLKNMVFSRCHLDQLPNIRACRSIEKMVVTQTKIHKLSTAKLKKSKSLKELALTFDTLDLAKAKWKPLPYLEKLVLTGNQLKEVPKGIHRFKNLHTLSLGENGITGLSKKVKLPRKLETISFYKNQLTQIPLQISTLQRLKSIDLYYNQITELPSFIATLDSLVILYASFNQLKVIPEFMGEMTSLNELYLHHNQITEVPLILQKLKDLKVLHLNHNYLTYLPDFVGNFTLLQDLDISYNRLDSLPESLIKLDNLQLLNIQENNFSTSAGKNPELDTLLDQLKEKGVRVLD